MSLVSLFAFMLSWASIAAAQARATSGLQTFYNKSLCIDIPAASKSPGAALQSWNCNSTSAQQFVFIKTPDGYFNIGTDGATDNCLDFGSKVQGAQVVQQKCNGNSSSQKWRIHLNSNNTYSILTMDASQSLNVNGSSGTAGAKIILWPFNNAPNEQFVFTNAAAGAALGFKPAVAGVCGSANGVAASMPPTKNLCSQGANTTLSGTGPWSWTCSGSGGGANAKCSAPLLVSNQQSIRSYAKCDGVTDDTVGLTKAFTAARNNAFKLIIDCPIRIRIGNDITRPIFVDNGTTVIFSGAGKLFLDNVGIPAFVIANTAHVSLQNWVVQYEGSLGVANSTNGGNFNDITLKNWMTKNRGVSYNNDTPLWAGPANTAATFLIKGSSTYFEVINMKIAVPTNVGGDRFMPMAFSFIRGERSNKTISRDSPMTSANFALPMSISFNGVDLDGTYFGFQGGMQNATFTKIRSHRYADLQDANGGNVGGVGKWFAPPHLFYLNYDPKVDLALANKNIFISDVIDYGNRVGVARDRATDKTLSGYTNSLKFGCIDGAVDNYTSARPDGFMDVLVSSNLKISNVKATYNSAFINNLFPAIRWPGNDYHNVSFTNVTISDLAPASTIHPIMGNPDPKNTNISFSNTVVNVKSWKGSQPSPEYSPTIPGTPVYFGGTGNNVKFTVNIGK